MGARKGKEPDRENRQCSRKRKENHSAKTYGRGLKGNAFATQLRKDLVEGSRYNEWNFVKLIEKQHCPPNVAAPQTSYSWIKQAQYTSII